jgi:hypothetical protein
MSGDRRPSEIERWRASVDADLYEDLLNRYERVLVFAGHLREKLNHQKLLSERNDDLERENERLQRVVTAGESYIRVLEDALSSTGAIQRKDEP